MIIIILLIFIIILITLVVLICNCFKKDKFENYKNCIAVLTKGYKNNSQYSDLIKRNEHILNNCYKKLNYPDILIFHEGNITLEQQNYIQSKTSKLPLKFIIVEFDHNRFNNIKEKIWKGNKGYKLMCDFWIHKFFKYTNSYKYLLRIDEDCFISNCDNIFEIMNKNKLVYTYKIWEQDQYFVTKGLRDFSKNFLINNSIKSKNDFKTIIPSGPYTNVFAIDLEYFNNNNIIIKKYIKEIIDSNNILIYRWGDLPLWGEILQMFVDKNKWGVNNTIKYYHGSHRRETFINY